MSIKLKLYSWDILTVLGITLCSVFWLDGERLYQNDMFKFTIY